MVDRNVEPIILNGTVLKKVLPVRGKAGEAHTLEMDASKVAKLKKAF